MQRRRTKVLRLRSGAGGPWRRAARFAATAAEFEAGHGRKERERMSDIMQIITEQGKCPYGNKRCLCQDCTDNSAWRGCKSGHCIDCFECERAGAQMHDVYLCTGHERRTDL